MKEVSFLERKVPFKLLLFCQFYLIEHKFLRAFQRMSEDFTNGAL